MNIQFFSIIKFFIILMLAFIGADRINLVSNEFEIFILTPYLLFSLIVIILILTFSYNEIILIGLNLIP